jgi:hypothetical protein
MYSKVMQSPFIRKNQHEDIFHILLVVQYGCAMHNVIAKCCSRQKQTYNLKDGVHIADFGFLNMTLLSPHKDSFILMKLNSEQWPPNVFGSL